ncbi:DUF6681 family protein [Loigolactobacillus bifermentans]|uniref:Uncharacterized protein n=1 Tax=Loigolactobacillus bifermentans DSM 20003 TaxID=1423726 RepID=A0A0R1GLJ1_9LACO|nr:DUF6681 family protein [Loigolactobacillus bifermentans]KRK32548.1 hypothetical protein FC07_GL001973 [Loigolactobacillus bifermentans DSM 20003]QGG60220.1 hypothetical protein LB003_06995 [Loigolactobacillus bifermentans]
MLSLLDMLNHYLGFFNMNVKLKNRIYTAIGILGDGYIAYLAIKLLRLHAWGRGFLFLLAFLGMTYFTVLNVIYYFTTKKAKFDISPKIEKLLGGKAATSSDDPMISSGTGKATAAGTTAKVMPAAGLFNAKKLLPATLKADTRALDQTVDELVKSGYLSLNYGGLGDREIYQQAQHRSEPFYAIGAATQVPFYELREERGQLAVYIGQNAINSRKVGTIESVGLMPVGQARQQFHLVLASAYLTGGPYKVAGRSGIVTGQEPFGLTVQLAHEDREATPTATMSHGTTTQAMPQREMTQPTAPVQPETSTQAPRYTAATSTRNTYVAPETAPPRAATPTRETVATPRTVDSAPTRSAAPRSAATPTTHSATRRVTTETTATRRTHRDR